jgi:hypothetical protein
VNGLLRSPLVFFVVAGLALFAAVKAFEDPADGDRGGDTAIVVERQALLDFVQLRSGEADAGALAARWDRLDEAARRVWIDRFVREEALVREARRLGLDRDDDLIRRRLIQQMEFLVEAGADEPIDAAALEAAYVARADEHRVPAIVTFGHVFVRDPGALTADPSSSAAARAESLRAALDEEEADFDGARARGDRFLYHRVYVDRTLDEVRAHFGPEMASSLERLRPEPARWQGPIASQHGWHVVLLTRRTEARVPSFKEIRGTLAEALRRERREASLERGLDEIVGAYEVRLAPGLDARPEAAEVDSPLR